MKKKVIMATALLCVAGVGASEPLDTLKTYELQDVQVTSTRASSKTPVAFKDLDKAEIKKVNFGQDVPYLLSLTPSVTTTSDAGNGIGYTSIRVRGVDPSRINITSNGIPMNDAESGQVYWVNIGDFSSSVQSMQIQRGAGTSTNGAGAFGATLNMQTDNLGTTPFFSIDDSAGSYYSHKETVRFGTGLLGDHWAVQGRVSNIGSKGYLDRESTKLNSYFLQAGYFGENTMVKFVTFNGVEETYHAWNYASKYEQSLYGRRYNSCGVYYDEDGNMRYYDNQTDNYHQQHYYLIWDQIVNPYWNFSLAAHYTKGQGYYEEYKEGKDLADYGLADTYATAYSDLVRQKKMDNDFYGAIASVNYNNLRGLKATLGSGWNRYDGHHFGLVKWVKNPINELFPDWEYYNNDAYKSDFNVYGKVEWEFVKGLNAFVDLQYRHVGYRLENPGDWWGANTDDAIWAHDDFDFLNPKFGLTYQISRNHKVYASYALTHKEPTRNDYEDNESRSLNAEKLQDVEVGYKYESPRFSAGVNLYYMYYDNQYVLTGELNDIGEMIASNDNSGKSYRAGVEVEAAWKPVDWFRWDLNATWSKNRAKDWTVTDAETDEAINLGDTHLSFSPDFIFNNIFNFNYKGFNAAIQSQCVGEQYLTNTGFKSYVNYNDDGTVQSEVGMMLEDFFQTNVNLSYTFAIKSLAIKEITLGVTFYNIFSDKHDNNGWAAPSYRMNNGKAEAYCVDDPYEAGFAPSAPFNWMAHVSINF